MPTELAYIIPTYGHFPYAARAIRSALANTFAADARIIVVDDASPSWMGVPTVFDEFKDLSKFEIRRFTTNGGLTRSWNEGIRTALDRGCKYICCTNSDVIFSKHWNKHCFNALENEYALVGPVTNAPGTEALQHVDRYYGHWDLTDEQAAIDWLGDAVDAFQGDTVVESSINGFCLLAKAETWDRYRFDGMHAFKPRNDFDSKGRPNATPLMTLQEYELQRRWRAEGLKIGICAGSFVFHYRSVTRGDAYTKGQAYRPSGPPE